MKNQLEQIIRQLSPNQFFGVTFVKRTTGEIRTMHCRLGVTPKTQAKNPGFRFDPSGHGLLPVYDVQKKDYRMINLDGITQLRINGKVFDFTKSKEKGE